MKKLSSTNLIFTAVLGILLLLILAVFFLKSSTLKPARSTSTSPAVEVEKSVTQTLQAVLASTNTEQPTQTAPPPTLTPLPPTPTEEPVPSSYYIRDITGNRQYYALGCEASAAVDLAWYYNVNIYQYEFQTALPLSDNPDLGFVGDVNGPWGQIPPYAYGVHAAPVVDLLNQFGVEVEGGKGYTLEQIKKALSESKPVIVWVIGHMEYSDPVQYTDKSGNVSIVAPYEHVVILTGYDEDSVRYLNNGKFADVENSVFLTSWGVLGNMAVFHK